MARTMTMDLTGELVNARRRQCELRGRLLDLSTSPLSPRQREKLMRLIRERRVMD